MNKQHVIDIFGTCSSIDWYQHPLLAPKIQQERKLLINFFTNMLSIHSTMSKPLPGFSLDQFPQNLPNHRKVIADRNFLKTFFGRLDSGRKPGEYLIIDCVSEHFDMWQTDDCISIDEASYRNWFLERFPQSQKIEKFAYFQNNKDNYAEVIQNFCQKISKYYERKKIIINKFFYLNEYREDGVVKSLDAQKCADHEKKNEILRFCYEELEKNLPGCRIFTAPEKTYLTFHYPFWDKGVTSGVHYETEFYRDFYQQLCEVAIEDEIEASLTKNISQLEIELQQKDMDLRKTQENAVRLEIEIANLQKVVEEEKRRTSELKEVLNSAKDELFNEKQIALLLQSDKKNLQNDLHAALQKTMQQENLCIELGERVARYHRMSKDPAITLYRKIRRTLGTWHY